MRPLVNVVYLIVDDLRPELGCYGRNVLTPNLDKLASQGVVFDRAYAQFAVCAPSRNSFMSGRRPDKTEVYNFQDDFREVGPTWVTLPQYFKQHNYTTLGGGKTFHPNLPPNWDEPDSWSQEEPYFAYDTDDVCNDSVGPVPPYNRTTDPPDDICTVSNETALYDYRLATVTIDRYQKYAETKPTFLAAGFRRPHLKNIVPKRFWDLYDDTELPVVETYPKDRHPMGWCCAEDTTTLNGTKNITKGPYAEAFNDVVTRDMRRGYFAAVSWTDYNIGRILDTVLGSAVVLVHGDHGYELGEMAMWRKRTNTELGTRVPLIVAGPGISQRRVPVPVELVDVYRTLADLAGLPSPPEVQGKSLRPSIEGGEKDDDDDAVAFSQFDRCPPNSTDTQLQGYCDAVAKENITYMGYTIRSFEWRYTVWLKFDGSRGLWDDCNNGGGFCERELYDHRNEDLADFDSFEVVNVAEDYPAMVENLHARLRRQFDRRRRNFLWFIVDDLRPPETTTPAMDALAETAFVFDLAFAQFAVCAPSRSSFMTGRRPSRTLDYNFIDSFRDTWPDWITLPQFFKNSGYKTLGASKTFHPDLPFNYDLPYSWDEYVPLLDVKCDDPLVMPVPPYNRSGEEICTVANETALQDYIVASKAIQWLADVNNNESFFFAVGMRRPHLPWTVPLRVFQEEKQQQQKKSLEQPILPRDIHNIAWSDEAFHSTTLNGTTYYNSGPWTQAFSDLVTSELRTGYHAAVRWVDEQIGRVVSALDVSPLKESTVVALIGDHGYSLGSKAVWTKHTVFDLGTRVPFIIRVPGVTGRRVTTPVELVDLYRTFADLAGLLAKVDNGVQGRSLTRYMSDDDDDDGVAFSQYDRCPTDGDEDNVTKYHGGCKRTGRNDIRYMGYSLRTSEWRYTAWMTFNGVRGQWEDCDDSANFCPRELYRHVPGDEAETSEATNFVLEYPGVATMLHERLRNAVDGNATRKMRLALKEDSLAVVSRRYASVTMDWWPCGSKDSGGNWCNATVLEVDLTNARLRSAVKLLAPGRLRIGGSLDAEVRYAFSDEDLPWCQEPRPFRGTENVTLCATKDRVQEIINFAEDAGLDVVWGLPYPGAYAAKEKAPLDSVDVPVWNVTQTAKLLRSFNFSAVELAEELTPVPNSTSYRNLVAAYRRLRTMTDLEIRGPCVGMASETNGDPRCLFETCDPSPFLQSFLREDDLVDVFCVHSYDNDAGTNWTRIPALASQLPRQLKRLSSGGKHPVVCGECGPHNQGGLDGVTDTTASSFWYLDALGRSARLGVREFGRQALFGAHYGLLSSNLSTYAAPNPDFWVAATWSRLMGPIVLDLPNFKDDDYARVYAHCSSEEGHVALAFLNVDTASFLDLDFSDLLPPSHQRFVLVREEWLFTTNLPDDASGLFLNGKRIDSHAAVLHHLEPARSYISPPSSQHILRVPPLAFGFLRVPTAHSACRRPQPPPVVGDLLLPENTGVAPQQ